MTVTAEDLPMPDNLAGPRRAAHAGADVLRHAGQILATPLALARMHPRADLDPQLGGRRAQLRRA